MLSIRIAKRLSKSFALAAEFEAPPGFTMLLGPSGSGKTTLLNCIAGLARPDAGTIALNGRVLFDSSSRINLPVQQRKLGYLFQNLALFPHLTIAENVEYGISKLPNAERIERAAAALESFRIAHLTARKPHEISGGERQRAALARALVTNPAMLLLDEPLLALDLATKAKIVDDLRTWNAEHAVPIVYVTHAPEEAYALGERVVVLDNGRVVARGRPNEVLKAPRHETVAQIVGFENVFDATVQSTSETQGTMLCRLDRSSAEIDVPLGHAAIGDRIRIAIRAGDIIVATEPPTHLSARNRLAARIVAIRREGSRVILTIEAGVEFEVHVTPRASDELELINGRQVWLVIKSYSCHLVAQSE
ncbi:molybdenum ABC transporter ATP-binding protein [Candidatus Binatus sp.]|uniref:molybdenum ABC transporter ATP-binding protein n=1 Tax=Candidatus Binatus sp. TaxID=2811406 RepID=UPI00272CFE8E|nr:molybdenum ABC transporter ATP-binding protein [Candidatus Binatus sp.]